MKLMPSQPTFRKAYPSVGPFSSKIGTQHPRVHLEGQKISINTGRKLNPGKSVQFSGLEGLGGILTGAVFNTAKDAVCKVGSAGIVGAGVLLDVFTGNVGTGLGGAIAGADAGLAHLFHESCTKFMKKVRLT